MPLTITIPGEEFWDKKAREFFYTEPVTLELEHSLVSLSKWESITGKPFIESDKTDDEAYLYMECMTLTPDFPPGVFSRVTTENLEQIKEYIDRPMTATWFREPSETQPKKGPTVTSEVIYNWMMTFKIPIELENWHLNRLITQIRVREAALVPPKKMSQAEIIAQNKKLNAERTKDGAIAG